jgi:hypothetical protein
MAPRSDEDQATWEALESLPRAQFMSALSWACEELFRRAGLVPPERGPSHTEILAEARRSCPVQLELFDDPEPRLTRAEWLQQLTDERARP